ncbi:hypothetical protein [Ammoniphilus sp. 3BR4]|uniref:hypothetical protein n=1 Tax=Ammoniphilus sp. 3BR4 TaxID=3158265 RepID=UPI00346766A8
MPDIQAGKVEMTEQEAERQAQGKTFATNDTIGFMRVDELGETHDEPADMHLGRS